MRLKKKQIVELASIIEKLTLDVAELKRYNESQKTPFEPKSKLEYIQDTPIPNQAESKAYLPKKDIISGEEVPFDNKPFGRACLGNKRQSDGVKTYPIYHGATHSYSSNSHWMLVDDTMVEFDGHRICFGVELQENNRYKSSYLSGDEIRKGCYGTLTANGIQVFDCTSRDFDGCYKQIEHFISEMEEHWHWFPNNTNEYIGKWFEYDGQEFYVDSFVVSQGCIIGAPKDGIRKPFWHELDEEGKLEVDEYELNDTIKVPITSVRWLWRKEKFVKSELKQEVKE